MYSIIKMESKLLAIGLSTGNSLRLKFEYPFAETSQIITGDPRTALVFWVKENKDGFNVVVPCTETNEPPDLSMVKLGNIFRELSRASGEYDAPVSGPEVKYKPKKPEQEESLIETIVKDGKTIFKIK